MKHTLTLITALLLVLLAPLAAETAPTSSAIAAETLKEANQEKLLQQIKA